jgi:hypothetical protein
MYAHNVSSMPSTNNVYSPAFAIQAQMGGKGLRAPWMVRPRDTSSARPRPGRQRPTRMKIPESKARTAISPPGIGNDTKPARPETIK